VIAAIRKKVKNSWIRPMTDTQGLKCILSVHLASDGSVIDVHVDPPGSGDEIFDRSAESAINKASPLRVPKDKDLFAKNFRYFKFCLADSDKLCPK